MSSLSIALANLRADSPSSLSTANSANGVRRGDNSLRGRGSFSGRGGVGRDGQSGRSGKLPPICSFYLRGKCNRGSLCAFRHESRERNLLGLINSQISLNSEQSVKKGTLCQYFAKGYCSRGSSCHFLHEYSSETPSFSPQRSNSYPATSKNSYNGSDQSGENPDSSSSFADTTPSVHKAKPTIESIRARAAKAKAITTQRSLSMTFSESDPDNASESRKVKNRHTVVNFGNVFDDQSALATSAKAPLPSLVPQPDVNSSALDTSSENFPSLKMASEPTSLANSPTTSSLSAASGTLSEKYTEASFSLVDTAGPTSLTAASHVSSSITAAKDDSLATASAISSLYLEALAGSHSLIAAKGASSSARAEKYPSSATASGTAATIPPSTNSSLAAALGTSSSYLEAAVKLSSLTESEISSLANAVKLSSLATASGASLLTASSETSHRATTANPSTVVTNSMTSSLAAASSGTSSLAAAAGTSSVNVASRSTFSLANLAGSTSLTAAELNTPLLATESKTYSLASKGTSSLTLVATAGPSSLTAAALKSSSLAAAPGDSSLTEAAKHSSLTAAKEKFSSSVQESKNYSWAKVSGTSSLPMAALEGSSSFTEATAESPSIVTESKTASIRTSSLAATEGAFSLTGASRKPSLSTATPITSPLASASMPSSLKSSKIMSSLVKGSKPSTLASCSGAASQSLAASAGYASLIEASTKSPSIVTGLKTSSIAAFSGSSSLAAATRTSSSTASRGSSSSLSASVEPSSLKTAIANPTSMATTLTNSSFDATLGNSSSAASAEPSSLTAAAEKPTPIAASSITRSSSLAAPDSPTSLTAVEAEAKCSSSAIKLKSSSLAASLGTLAPSLASRADSPPFTVAAAESLSVAESKTPSLPTTLGTSLQPLVPPAGPSSLTAAVALTQSHSSTSSSNGPSSLTNAVMGVSSSSCTASAAASLAAAAMPSSLASAAEPSSLTSVSKNTSSSSLATASTPSLSSAAKPSPMATKQKSLSLAASKPSSLEESRTSSLAPALTSSSSSFTASAAASSSSIATKSSSSKTDPEAASRISSSYLGASANSHKFVLATGGNILSSSSKAAAGVSPSRATTSASFKEGAQSPLLVDESYPPSQFIGSAQKSVDFTPKPSLPILPSMMHQENIAYVHDDQRRQLKSVKKKSDFIQTSTPVGGKKSSLAASVSTLQDQKRKFSNPHNEKPSITSSLSRAVGKKTPEKAPGAAGLKVALIIQQTGNKSENSLGEGRKMSHDLSSPVAITQHGVKSVSTGMGKSHEMTHQHSTNHQNMSSLLAATTSGTHQIIGQSESTDHIQSCIVEASHVRSAAMWYNNAKLKSEGSTQNFSRISTSSLAAAVKGSNPKTFQKPFNNGGVMYDATTKSSSLTTSSRIFSENAYSSKAENKCAIQKQVSSQALDERLEYSLEQISPFFNQKSNVAAQVCAKGLSCALDYATQNEKINPDTDTATEPLLVSSLKFATTESPSVRSSLAAAAAQPYKSAKTNINEEYETSVGGNTANKSSLAESAAVKTKAKTTSSSVADEKPKATAYFKKTPSFASLASSHRGKEKVSSLQGAKSSHFTAKEKSPSSVAAKYESKSGKIWSNNDLAGTGASEKRRKIENKKKQSVPQKKMNKREHEISFLPKKAVFSANFIYHNEESIISSNGGDGLKMNSAPPESSTSSRGAPSEDNSNIKTRKIISCREESLKETPSLPTTRVSPKCARQDIESDLRNSQVRSDGTTSNEQLTTEQNNLWNALNQPYSLSSNKAIPIDGNNSSQGTSKTQPFSYASILLKQQNSTVIEGTQPNSLEGAIKRNENCSKTMNQNNTREMSSQHHSNIVATSNFGHVTSLESNFEQKSQRHFARRLPVPMKPEVLGRSNKTNDRWNKFESHGKRQIENKYHNHSHDKNYQQNKDDNNANQTSEVHKVIPQVSKSDKPEISTSNIVSNPTEKGKVWDSGFIPKKKHTETDDNQMKRWADESDSDDD